MVSEALAAAAAGGAAAVGLRPCLWAASVRAIDALYVREEASVPGVACDRSRWLALSGEICPLCGEATRRTPDVVDELVEAVLEDGGSIHHVPEGSELDERIAAASLRFRPPPAPELTGHGEDGPEA
jgi:peptide chain release factor subunit 1